MDVHENDTKETFWSNIKLRWKIVTSVLATVSMLVVGWNFVIEFDGRYVKAAEAKEKEKSFIEYQQQQNTINSHVINQLEVIKKQSRIDMLERYYMENKIEIPLHVQKEIQHLKTEIYQLQSE